jgi:hypothetical protein
MEEEWDWDEILAEEWEEEEEEGQGGGEEEEEEWEELGEEEEEVEGRALCFPKRNAYRRPRSGVARMDVLEELEEIRAQLEEMNKTLTHMTMIHLSALLFISVVLALLLLR